MADSDELKDSLDFERPIAELEQKIQDLEKIAVSQQIDHDSEIAPLRMLRDKLLKKIFSELTPWERVRLARHPRRPLTSDYLETVFENVVELHGDRVFGNDAAIVTAFAELDGERVLMVGHRKGRTTEERVACYWGCAHPEGYRKALSKMQLAEKFGLPIVTFIDTPGAYPGIGAEERGQASAIARNIMEMSTLKVPVVSLVIGEGGSGGALGIGVADRLLILENAYYSVISPEGCAAILWKDGELKTRAAEALRLTSADLLRLGIVDEVIEEPPGGAHRDPEKMADSIRTRLGDLVRELRAVPVDQLLEQRYRKYRSIGDFQWAEPSATPTQESAEAE